MNVPPRALIIDDEQSISEVVAFVLGKTGSEVVIADSGQRGLEIFKQHRMKFDIAITDINCLGGGNCDGIQLARELRKIQPNLPIIFMSGGLGRYDMRDLAEISPYFLRKPFSAQELKAIVCRILSEDARLMTAI